MTIEIANTLRQKAHAFKGEAHLILSGYESSKSRIFSLDKTRSILNMLSLQQDELFQQSLVCIERGIFRAAHVMAWAGFMDFLEQKLSSDGLIKVKSVRTGWNRYNTIEEIRENVPEFQLIEAARDVGLLSKSETKTLLGLLSKRNECAHPSAYKPGLNESLGYVSELLNRIKQLDNKSL
ncbi:MAG: hypothetical protein ONB37_17140 [candidate division KSB1 bacterium]|nr:hypothetical protein [candidate division KSB1 bacterium]